MQVILGDLAVDIWFIGLGVLIVALLILWRRKHSLSYLVCFAFFGVYLLYGIGKVFFPIYVSGQYVDVMRQQPSLIDINLIPFYFGPFTTLSNALPGMILEYYSNRTIWLWVKFYYAGQVKELYLVSPCRWFWNRDYPAYNFFNPGYPYRVIDINDALMNTVGVLVGYAIFRDFSWLYLWATKHFHIKHEGLSAYIYHIVANHIQPEKTHEETILNTTKVQ